MQIALNFSEGTLNKQDITGGKGRKGMAVECYLNF